MTKLFYTSFVHCIWHKLFKETDVSRYPKVSFKILIYFLLIFIFCNHYIWNPFLCPESDSGQRSKHKPYLLVVVRIIQYCAALSAARWCVPCRSTSSIFQELYTLWYHVSTFVPATHKYVTTYVCPSLISWRTSVLRRANTYTYVCPYLISWRTSILRRANIKFCVSFRNQ